MTWSWRGVDPVTRGGDAVGDIRANGFECGIHKQRVDSRRRAADIGRIEVDLGGHEPRAVVGPPEARGLEPEVALACRLCHVVDVTLREKVRAARELELRQHPAAAAAPTVPDREPAAR